MALAITMKEGDRVFANDMPIRLERVTHHGGAVASTEDGTHPVTGGKWTKINNWVSIRLGKASNLGPGEVRVLFQAPKSVKLLREAVYMPSRKAEKPHKRVNGSVCSTCKGTKTLSSRGPCDSCRGSGCPACKGVGIVPISFRCPDCGD